MEDCLRFLFLFFLCFVAGTSTDDVVVVVVVDDGNGTLEGGVARARHSFIERR